MKDSNLTLDVFEPDFFNSFIENLEKKNSKNLLAIIKDFHPADIASIKHLHPVSQNILG